MQGRCNRAGTKLGPHAERGLLRAVTEGTILQERPYIFWSALCWQQQHSQNPPQQGPVLLVFYQSFVILEVWLKTRMVQCRSPLVPFAWGPRSSQYYELTAALTSALWGKDILGICCSCRREGRSQQHVQVFKPLASPPVRAAVPVVLLYLS